MTTGSNAKESQGTVDFQDLIMGFSSAALYYMEETAVEGKAKATKNMVLARQNIDIILILKEKTKGNLSDDESQMIEQVLADLQLKFVEAAK
jgi:hypothetical protein